MPSLETVQWVLLTVVLPIITVATVLLSVAVVSRLHRADARWGDVARSRLVMGVPWGSLIVIALVWCVYLFVQDGITAFDDPVTIPYRAYSYFYPLGMLTASFSHAGPNHILGNLAAAVVVAPIAEYAWGHYPDERGAESSDSWRTDPWFRALLLFPLVVVAITIITSLFALGPVIGFSGVVFAFAAFALVHYPIVTIVGVLGVQGVLLTLYRALRNPIGIYVAESSPPSAPSWAGIAIQGHALGFFIGLVLGIALLRRRGHRPDALRIWIAILIFGFAQGLWQIYWFGGGNVFYLFQGPGVLIVTVLALVVTVAITATERPLVPERISRRFTRVRGPPSESAVARPLELARNSDDRSETSTDATALTAPLERISELAATPNSRDSSRLSSIGQRQAAFTLVLVVLAVLAGMAIPVNFFVLDDANVSSDAAVEIEDYTIQYAEDVEYELVSPVRVGPLSDAVALDASGVIVTSEERQLWAEVVPARQLEFSSEESIAVGGPGWRETVHVERIGWEPVGNDSVYQVEIWAEGDDPQLAHESNGSRADVRIDDQNVTMSSVDGEFTLEVESIETGEVETTTVPESNESTTAGGLAFEREDDTIYAAADGTRIAIANEE
ncbi:rhomboid family intramembrane serine protease [Natronorubrum texcoconense]|uniref:Membrane associated serine protease, rhomboid family n=1 Tax=Natronorubrum texcoconense TaxID=1095776 RepID=A0A1G8ZPX1_9EURY|nr:rhomboid family intramembrane serine protease [Natronorubrum texcoconense]SDK17118.1 Membrane associated serine protease, rhomboid family [Natronorubrum texcoconense]